MATIEIKTLKVSHTKQQGVVLIVALVFLAALTAVAAALMQNASTDVKMSGASQEKTVATQEAVSALDELLYNEITQTNGTNNLTTQIANFPLSPAVSTANTTTNVDFGSAYDLETDCPHSRAPSSSKTIKCYILRVEVNKHYGKNNNSTIEVRAGVAQEFKAGD